VSIELRELLVWSEYCVSRERVTSIQYELKSSSYESSCIKCMAVTRQREVIVIVQMAVVVKL
jgi:hypothetical protein